MLSEMEEEKNIITLLEDPKATVLQLCMHQDVINMKNNERVTKFFTPAKMWELIRFPIFKNFGLPENEYKQITLDCPKEKYAESLKKVPYVCNELLKAESLVERLIAEYPYLLYAKNLPEEPINLMQSLDEAMMEHKQPEPKQEVATEPPKQEATSESLKQEATSESLKQEATSESLKQEAVIDTPNQSEPKKEAPVELPKVPEPKEEIKDLSLGQAVSSSGLTNTVILDSSCELSFQQIKEIKESQYCYLDGFLSFISSSSISDPTMYGYFAATLNNLISSNCKLILERIEKLKLIKGLVSNFDKIPTIDIIRNLLQGYIDNKEDVATIRASFIESMFSSLSVKGVAEDMVNDIVAFIKQTIEMDIYDKPLTFVEKTLELLNNNPEPIILYACFDILTLYFSKAKDDDPILTNLMPLKKAMELIKVETNKMKIPTILKLFIASFIPNGPFSNKSNENTEIITAMSEILPKIYSDDNSSSVVLTSILAFYNMSLKLPKKFHPIIFNEPLIKCMKETNKIYNHPKYPIACEISCMLKNLKSQSIITEKLPTEVKDLYKSYKREIEVSLIEEQLSCNVNKADAMKAYYELIIPDMQSSLTIDDDEGDDMLINDI